MNDSRSAPGPLGDLDPSAFRSSGLQILDWVARYLAGDGEYPVLSRLAPGEIRNALPVAAPEHGAPMEEILRDFQRILVPGLTHWNHPRFFAYFSSSGSAPGVLGEFLTAALNQQAMLWRTSPVATELEAVVLGWLRQSVGLPESFEGVLYDGGSASNLHALIAARHLAVARVRSDGLAGRSDVPALRVYCSEHGHSSIDKAAIVLGLGQKGLRKVAVDEEYRMRADALEDALREDDAAGVLPVAVVATVGTTSTSSIDPVPAIADLCRARGVWLHVDASYAGPAAMVPEHSWIFDGVSRADSLVMNPHKWLFTPLDASAFYCRRMDILRSALALTPAYLEARESGSVQDLMDTGIALARRFRALKLWMVMRSFGAAGLRARIAEHVRLARLFAQWVDQDASFERLAPVPLSVVCFRAAPRGVDADALDRLNELLLERVNASGEVFLSHTRLDGRVALRLAIGQVRTREADVAAAWGILKAKLDEVRRLTHPPAVAGPSEPARREDSGVSG